MYDEEQLDLGATLIGEANWQYFTGNNQLSDKEIENIKSEVGYQVINENSEELKKYLDSIIKVANNPDVLEINIE